VSRQAKYLKNRRLLGQCGYGGCEVVTGDTMYCVRHADEINTRRRKRVAERAKAKLAAASTALAILKRSHG
jgi:hypothetical protein